eukprot:TRINITY_DN72306_c0_g1_i1.p1 TRINITY_DN72306_c0_g1~~TRINITY_DN72306_c0_g1_i1.p1  ORF type:complete len:306 (+),score=62.39 TRINITY_DN72306_c0_g1_i1:36-920(+)
MIYDHFEPNLDEPGTVAVPEDETGPRQADEQQCMNCDKRGRNYQMCPVCHDAWYCSPKCEKDYQPFHRVYCRRNDFADSVRATNPEFAKWLRQHGKQAVITDRDVDLLNSPTANMQHLYGRATHEAAPAKYSEEEVIAMREREDRERKERQKSAPFDRAWTAIDIPEGLGAASDEYKWKQAQAYVYVYIPIRDATGKAKIDFRAKHVRVACGQRVLFEGELLKEIMPDESCWQLDRETGIIEVVMMKKWRRDKYKTGETNADTWWRTVLEGATSAVISEQQAPSVYYSAPFAYH